MKISSTSPASARSLLGVTIVLLITFAIETASAKRGCSAFGHSCFGGHGKRSEASDLLGNTIQDDLRESEDSRNFDAPRGDGEILIAGGGQTFQERPMPRFPPQQTVYKLSPFLRQLMDSYRPHGENSVDFETK